MGKSKRKRIDKLLVEKGHIESRERAQRLILAGQVLADERVIDKPGTLVKADPKNLTFADILGTKLRWSGSAI